jgi:hypothetical protein
LQVKSSNPVVCLNSHVNQLRRGQCATTHSLFLNLNIGFLVSLNVSLTFINSIVFRISLEVTILSQKPPEFSTSILDKKNKDLTDFK